jgi:hypothetical protein
MTEDGNFTRHPSDILIDLIAALLTPLFIGPAGGDLRYARMAALETIWSYKVTTQADLLQVVQIVAFSLASIQTLCAAMTGDVTPQLLLRLMNGAERLTRAEGQIRKLRQAEQANAVAHPPSPHQPPAPRPGPVCQPVRQGEAATETPAERVRDARETLATAYASEAAKSQAPKRTVAPAPAANLTAAPGFPGGFGMASLGFSDDAMAQMFALAKQLHSKTPFGSGSRGGVSWDAMMDAQEAAPDGQMAGASPV